MHSLKGKVALITGGSSGIGRATALAFAREGAQVIIAARGAERGRQVAQEIQATGGESLFVAVDVSKADDVASLIQTVEDKYGRLDCAFNNAAQLGELRLTTDYAEDEFDQMVAVNLKSVWLCMKYEIQQMLRRIPPGGAIVNMSSINGLGGAPQSALYAMSKAGVLALTKSAALEYATQGIRINGLVAGAFRTPMLEGVFDEVSEGDPQKRAAIESGYNQRIAVGRLGKPEEVAEAVVWLCSDAASYVTGHSMIVDGGASAAFR